MTGPLTGLRVLELATGVAGPYAGRLLGMLGATVVKVEPPGGDPARRLPVDDQPMQLPSPVFVHLNAGKRLIMSVALPAALKWADVVLGEPDLPSSSLIVSIPDAEPDDELLIQARSGLLSASLDEHGKPLRFPGWQTQYLAGAYAAALVLAGLSRGARRAEVSCAGAALSAVEAHAAGELYTLTSPRPDDPEERRNNAGQLAQTYPSGVFACADGYVIPGTVRAADWTRQCDVYGRPELVWDPRFVWANRWSNREALADELRPWYLARARREIFAAALESGWAAAMVLTARDALTEPHLRERGFFGPVTGAARATVAARPWRSRELPEGVPLHLSEPDGDRAWFDPGRPRSSATPRPPSPERLRVVELTWAWAGPFAGRFLGTLGADVVRVEAGSHPDGWRTRQPRGDEYTWDASAQFNSLNRSKRAVSVDLATADGAGVFCDLVSAADVLIVNMNPQVLQKNGVDDHVQARVGCGLVAMTMPSLGASGPYRSMPGYGMLSEGMGGFAARYGSPAEGARASTTYYADAVAGIHGVVAVLSALAGRAVHGRGDWIDLSQQETLWLQLGEGLVLASREGRDPARLGSPPLAFETVRSLFESGTCPVEELDHPVAGKRAYLALPVLLDGQSLPSTLPAPMFDQHTDEVLAEWLGYSADRILELRASAAVGTVPRQPRRKRQLAPSA